MHWVKPPALFFSKKTADSNVATFKVSLEFAIILFCFVELFRIVELDFALLNFQGT